MTINNSYKDLLSNPEFIKDMTEMRELHKNVELLKQRRELISSTTEEGRHLDIALNIINTLITKEFTSRFLYNSMQSKNVALVNMNNSLEGALEVATSFEGIFNNLRKLLKRPIKITSKYRFAK